jgi:hypothetical protein
LREIGKKLRDVKTGLKFPSTSGAVSHAFFFLLYNGICFLLVLSYDLYYFQSNSDYVLEQHWPVGLLHTGGTVHAVMCEIMCEVFVREFRAVQD